MLLIRDARETHSFNRKRELTSNLHRSIPVSKNERLVQIDSTVRKIARCIVTDRWHYAKPWRDSMPDQTRALNGERIIFVAVETKRYKIIHSNIMLHTESFIVKISKMIHYEFPFG